MVTLLPKGSLLQNRAGCIFPLLITFLCACASSSGPEPLHSEKNPGISMSLVAKGLAGPVAMEASPDGSGRLFICEQTGTIRIIKNGKLLEKPFLDIRKKMDRISKGYSEKGLIGFTFHPDFKNNGRFFVYYSAHAGSKNFDHKSRIAEYHASPGTDTADFFSEKIILEIGEPESNHNGGQLVFGPDSFLYIGCGDGGGAGDEHGDRGNGQTLNTLLGKILRIDVDAKTPYAVPPNNPFVNLPGVKPEIWAYGLRNPWRFSFDRKTGQLFCADVGQDKWEEVDIIEKGKNYGWRIMEGNHCYDPLANCKTKDLALPIAEYDHKKGICIIGGYVYRGKKIPSLYGRYIFADWQGKLFQLEEINGAWHMNDLLPEGMKENKLGLTINSFGQDESGELYILVQPTAGPDESGAVYKLVPGKGG